MLTEKLYTLENSLVFGPIYKKKTIDHIVCIQTTDGTVYILYP